MATRTRTISLYRSLLRELPPRRLLASPRAPIHHRLRESFAATSTTTSPTATAPLHPDTAEQLVAYLRAQRTYAALVERYNPGMNMDDEERVRLSARRVGMNLPVEFAEETGKGRE